MSRLSSDQPKQARSLAGQDPKHSKDLQVVAKTFTDRQGHRHLADYQGTPPVDPDHCPGGRDPVCQSGALSEYELPKNGSPPDAALLKVILPLVGGAFVPGKLAQE
jgi:hypothetical protein